jgi:chemotaxis signal transduction protein
MPAAIVTPDTAVASSHTLSHIDSPARLLTFQVREIGSLAFDLDQTGQVLEIERDSILPIAEMPAAVMGVYRLRGRALWLVDMATLCGLSSLHLQRSRRGLVAITLALSAGRQWGLVVDSLEDILQVDPLSWLPFQAEANAPPDHPLDRLTLGWLRLLHSQVRVLDPNALVNVLQL